jgi:hypothetical protein
MTVEATKQFRDFGAFGDELPSLSTLIDMLDRNDYRFRPALKAKTQKFRQNQKQSLLTISTKMESRS